LGSIYFSANIEPMPIPILALLVLAPQTVKLTPTADIWVYANASEPGSDEYLRIWGLEGRGAPADAGDAQEMSFAYMKWDLSSIPSDKKLTKATLTLTNIANPGYTLDQAKAAPLQARPVGIAFEEKTWTYDMLGKLLPDKEPEHIFGTGYPATLTPDKTNTIVIDLLKGPGDFRTALGSALKDKSIALALTSGIDMASLGRTGIYKLFSKDSKEEAARPTLTLDFE